MNILNKKILGDRFPAFIIHIYYLLISCTFCYIYAQKFLPTADFYGNYSSGGIYSVLNFSAVRPIQFRILIPVIFKILSFVSFHKDKLLFVFISVVITYFILLSFYLLLNCYFKSKAHNCWLTSIIIYPMIWNYIIMNGQFFYMDFSVLLIIILGFYFIVTVQYNSLLILFFLGTLNHPSVGYLIIAFLLFNYQRLFKIKTILYSSAMAVLYIAVYKIMDAVLPNTDGYFVIFNMPRNLGLFTVLPAHIIIRDAIFNFGGLHFFYLLFFISGKWKIYRSPLLYINLTVIPYVLSVLVSFSIEELRNYIAIIPFVLIPCLVYLSTFENSFLKPVEELFTRSKTD